MAAKEFDIKSKSDGFSDGITYEHPSYGMIRVMRCQSQGGIPLFGQDTDSVSTISVQIQEAEVNQHLGRNWYHSKKTITEVEMSPIQYAEMISNPNTEGVPCTIRTTQEHGRIEYNSPDSRTQYVQSKIETTISELKENAQSTNDKINEILNQKGPLKKDDKEQIKNMVFALSRKIYDDLPFYEKSIAESIDRQKAEAKTDIQAMLLHEVTKAGYNSIQTGDGVLRIGHTDSDK